MIELLNFSCKSKREKDKEERKWIENLKPTLNVQIPTRSKEEYNRTDKMKEYYKNYHKEYKKTEKFQEYQKKYLKSDKAKAYKKAYQQKDDYKRKRSEKIKCDCGCFVSRGNISTHKKSKKCIDKLSTIKL